MTGYWFLSIRRANLIISLPLEFSGESQILLSSSRRSSNPRSLNRLVGSFRRRLKIWLLRLKLDCRYPTVAGTCRRGPDSDSTKIPSGENRYGLGVCSEKFGPDSFVQSV